MAISFIWRMHSVRLDHATTDVIVGSMNSVGMPTDAEVVREVNASRLYPFQAHTNFRSIGINFTSWNLADLLEVIPIGGLCFGTGLTYTAVIVQVAKYDCNSIVDITEYTVNKGVIFPTSITVDHQGNSQISYTIIGIYDGTNAPVVKLDGVAVGAGHTIPAGEDERWTMYEAWVGGVQVLQVKSINVDFGHQTTTEGADSEPFDSWVSIDQVLPMVTFQGITPDFLKQASPGVEEIATLDGEAVLGGADVTRISLKERGSAIAVAKHILIDVWGLARVTDPYSSTGNDAGRSEVKVDGYQVGANVPLTIQTDVAIPA